METIVVAAVIATLVGAVPTVIWGMRIRADKGELTGLRRLSARVEESVRSATFPDGTRLFNLGQPTTSQEIWAVIEPRRRRLGPGTRPGRPRNRRFVRLTTEGDLVRVHELLMSLDRVTAEVGFANGARDEVAEVYGTDFSYSSNEAPLGTFRAQDDVVEELHRILVPVPPDRLSNEADYVGTGWIIQAEAPRPTADTSGATRILVALNDQMLDEALAHLGVLLRQDRGLPDAVYVQLDSGIALLVEQLDGDGAWSGYTREVEAPSPARAGAPLTYVGNPLLHAPTSYRVDLAWNADEERATVTVSSGSDLGYAQRWIKLEASVAGASGLQNLGELLREESRFPLALTDEELTAAFVAPTTVSALQRDFVLGGRMLSIALSREEGARRPDAFG